MNVTTENENEEKVKYLEIIFMFYACVLLAISIGTGMLYYMYRHKLQPTHLFELSVSAGLVVHIACNGLAFGLQPFFTGYHPFCLLSNFLVQTSRCVRENLCSNAPHSKYLVLIF